MTDLERIEIEGFKGLESVSFEPSGINLITGRNNTGKTSLLEAISLLFNPTHLHKFGDNIDRIINVDYDTSVIHVDTSERGSTLELGLPDNKQTPQFFAQSVFNFVVSRNLSHNFGSRYDDEIEDLKENFEIVVQGILDQEFNEDDISDLKEEFIKISIDGETFPYYSSGKKSEEVLSDIHTLLENEYDETVSKDFRDLLGVKRSQFVEYDDSPDNSAFSIVPKAHIAGAKGYLKSPEGTDVVNFINSTELTEEIEQPDGEKDAIKVDDIGDYIREKKLIDNLKTFDIDYLVFEKDDGKKYQIPYDFMGDGFKAVVGLLWELLDDSDENDIVLLEEPENHMHPGYIREVVYFLIDLAKNEGVQLFITTHNSDFINSFFTENLTDEEEEYLEEGFSLIRMEEDTTVVQDYETAKDDLKNLHLDLRGI